MASDSPAGLSQHREEGSGCPGGFPLTGRAVVGALEEAGVV